MLSALVFQFFRARFQFLSMCAQVAIVLMSTLGIKVEDLKSRSWGAEEQAPTQRYICCLCGAHAFLPSASLLLPSELTADEGARAKSCVPNTLQELCLLSKTSVYLRVSMHLFMSLQLQHQIGVAGVKISFIHEFLRSS